MCDKRRNDKSHIHFPELADPTTPMKDLKVTSRTGIIHNKHVNRNINIGFYTDNTRYIATVATS